MKRIVLIIAVFIFTGLISYGSCFKATGDINDDLWYGKFKLKDFASGNIYMQNAKTGDVCGGFWFNTNPRVTTSKDTKIFSRMTCTSNKLFEMNVNEKIVGEIIDQEKNVYKVSMIKKKEYKKAIKKNGKKNNAEDI